MKISNTKSGYSLIEMIVYIAIFAVLAVLVINSFIVVLSSFNQTRTNRDLLESGNTMFERVSREIRLANSVTTGESTLGSSPGVLTLSGIDDVGASRVVKFIVENGKLNLYEDGVLVGPLNGQNTQVTSLIFRQITTTNSSAVKVELTLQDLRGKNRKTVNFYDTVILRGGY